MKVVILGGRSGKMGKAFVKGLSRPDSGMTVVATGRGEDSRTEVASADIVILATKPKDLAEVMSQLAGHIRSDAVVISIVAGKRVATIQSGLGHERVVRAMPNLPGQIGHGITGWYAPPAICENGRSLTRRVLRSLGGQVRLAVEELINPVTALSGSGPAYIAFFASTLIDAGMEMGLTEKVASRLVMKTIEGTVKYLRSSRVSFQEFINRVRTPGGTTEAAFVQFCVFQTAIGIKKAVFAARDRANELGK